MSTPGPSDAPAFDAAAFDAAVQAHDAAVRALGLDIWVGSEPTFTDRLAHDPEWTSAALGDEKRRRAERLVARLATNSPGAAVLRSVGRHYPGESLPRWSYGLLCNRDGGVLWQGPPDPLLATGTWPGPDLPRFADYLVEEAWVRGFAAALLPSQATSGVRLLVREGEAQPSAPPSTDYAADARLLRPSCHDVAIPNEGLRDELADEGCYLFILCAENASGNDVIRVELPALGDSARLRRVLDLVAAAALRAGLPALILAGFPPPVDATLAWTTITPDPAVLEVNMAPYSSVEDLLVRARELFAATDKIGLAPYRLWYNGEVGDSGGGGHITLGGPAPRTSPFLLRPQLLPRLVRYTNRHPCLSYLFAHDYIGASGQSVRADERDREHFDELGVALGLLARNRDPQPELIWRSLAPFLADMSGNTHRAELNVEKLWNPYLPDRGCLGLVEFRALRMAPSAQRLAALAVLLRSIAVRLAVQPFEDALIDWGAELHDRFALPFFLRRDLHAVFADLERAGCGLAAPVRGELLDDECRVLGRVRARGVELSVRRALEFWPLVGDAASQERGTSRLVDSSTARIELCLRPDPDADPAQFPGWQLAAHDIRLPLRTEADETGPAKVFALRYRCFLPWSGLHPALPAHGPVALLLWHAQRDEAYRITLHEWRPDQQPYDGLPSDVGVAQARRQARMVCEAAAKPGSLPDPPGWAVTPWCLDLRQL